MSDVRRPTTALLDAYVRAIDEATQLPLLIPVRVRVHQGARARLLRALARPMLPIWRALRWRPLAVALLKRHIRRQCQRLATAAYMRSLTLDRPKTAATAEELQAMDAALTVFVDRLAAGAGVGNTLKSLWPIMAGFIVAAAGARTIYEVMVRVVLPVVSVDTGETGAIGVVGLAITLGVIPGSLLVRAAFTVKRQTLFPLVNDARLLVACPQDWRRNAYAREDTAWQFVGARKPREFPLDVVIGPGLIVLLLVYSLVSSVVQGPTEGDWESPAVYFVGYFMGSGVWIVGAVVYAQSRLAKRQWR